MVKGLRKMIFCAGIICLLFVQLPAAYAAKEADGVHITIFHTNDMHARVQAGDDYGKSMGLAQIAAVIKEQKAKDPDTIALDAGDILHGMPMINISKGENAVRLLNEAGYDAMVPGNHDYNYGSEQLLKLSRELNFPVLSANTVDKKSKKLLFPAYKEMELDGVRIAVFGLTTPETAYKSAPKNVKSVSFQDPVAAAQKMVDELRANHDVLIAVTHIGLDKSSVVTSEVLAQKVKGIDVIIDGHSHTDLPQGLVAGDTLIAQTGWHDYRLGEVDLVVRNHQVTAKSAKLLDAAAAKQLAPVPEAAIKSLLDEMEAQNKKAFDTIVAHSPKNLSGERELVRTQETEIGDLCTDAFRWEAKADIAITNGGSIRQGIQAGPITKREIMAVFPFGNTLQKIEVSGAVLRQILEHSVSGYPAASGGFLQVSGISFCFDAAKPVGQRIVSVQVGNAPLQERKLYTLAANDFLVAGGDGYTMLPGAKVLGEYGTCEEIIADYLNQVGMMNLSMGRILCQSVEEKKAA